MKFTIHIKDDKAPFFLELIQQLGFAKLEKMEGDTQPIHSLQEESKLDNTSEELKNLRNEISDFFGS